VIASTLILVSVTLSPAERYIESNQSYEAGDFLHAIEGYEEVVRLSRNADVYYNLGNSYFQVRKLGEAVANYRRARHLRPRDGDVQHNLAFLRNYRVDRIGSVSSPITQLLSNGFHYFSLYEASILTTFLFLLGSFLIFLFILYRKRSLAYGFIVGGVVCTYFFITWQVWMNEVRSVPAVVVVTEAAALSGPGEDYKEVFIIHDGAEVKIKEERGGYILIQIPGGI